MAKRNFNSSKKNSNGKGKTSRNKNNNNKLQSRDKYSEASSPTNDPAWYANSEAMMRDSASFPFNEAIGTPYKYDEYMLEDQNSGGEKVVSGVLMLALAPTIGNSQIETSALNTAARKLFNTLRAFNNSGNPPYDPNDLMLVEVAIANAYAYVNMCARLYGVLNTFVQKNRYLPKALVTAMGFDYDDFRDHMAQFRWDLDYMISSLASLWAPGNIPYFAQCSQQYAGYYVEGDDVKDQLYVTAPLAFLKYNLASDTYPGGALTSERWLTRGSSDGLFTRKDTLDYYNDLVAPLMNNSDVNLISGDVRKAFGDAIIKIGEIPLNYQILPTADLNMLEKFKNANCIAPFQLVTVAPDDEQGFLVSVPTVKAHKRDTNTTAEDCFLSHIGVITGGRKMLSTIRQLPTPSDVMEMTRWCPLPMMETLTNVAEDDSKYQYQAEIDCGTYVPGWFRIVHLSNTGEVETIDFSNVEMFSTGGDMHDMANITLLSAFKFHPSVRFFIANTDGTEFVSLGEIFDVDNYTNITTEDVHRMNETALFSLFGAN